MGRPPLSLDYFFVTRSVVIAAPVKDSPEVLPPEVKCQVHVSDPSKMFGVVNVVWGVEGETPYYIEAEVHASFGIELIHEGERWERGSLEVAYSSLSVNAVQILYTTLRSHIANATAVGPHETWFLPTIGIDESDVELFAGADAFSIADDEPAKKKKPSKPKAQRSKA